MFPLPAEEPEIFTEELLIIQANVAPETLEEREIPVVVPLQIVCEGGVAVTLGIGLTVTGTINGALLHEFADAIIE